MFTTGTRPPAFRGPKRFPDLVYKVLVREPMIVVLPSGPIVLDIAPGDRALKDLAGETFIAWRIGSGNAFDHEDYIGASGIDLKPTATRASSSMAMSLVEVNSEEWRCAQLC